MKTHSPILSSPFRAFFLFAALIATINPTLWISHYTNYIDLSLNSTPLFWHGHEMIFGFTQALLAGLLLTTSAKRTAMTSYQGKPLLLLIIFWIIERVAFFIPFSDLTVMILNNIFFPLLIALLYLKFKDHQKQRNLFIPLLLLLYVLKLTHSISYYNSYIEMQEIALYSSIATVRFITLLIAGRLLPSVTQEKLKSEKNEVPPLINKLTLLSLLLTIIPTNFFAPTYQVTLIMFFAVIMNTIRNFYMFNKEALKSPLLLVLHLGINFMLVGLMFELAQITYPNLNNNQALLHFTMAGGLGLFGIGIMTRITLEQTRRNIKADKWMQFAFWSVMIGAVLRVLFPIFIPEYYDSSLHNASGFWTLGFLIFILKFIKVMFAARVDGAINKS
jgi:uncharacterized protein involved in response to NO